MPLLDVLPVTALTRIQYANVELVLAGKGRKVVVYDAERGTQVCEAVLPIVQAVHGIVPLSKAVPQQDLLIFGGRVFVWITICFEPFTGSTPISALKIRDSAQVQDWVLCGRPKDFTSSSAVLVTSYNALIQVVVDQRTHKIETTVLCDTFSTFLYSADLLAIDTTTYIVASGTAFGEVLTWLCKFDSVQDSWTAYPWRDFRAHTGSIFGVSVSPIFTINNLQRRILASCSDDRTIRIWDLTNIENTAQASDIQSANVKSVEHSKFMQHTENLATTWAHVSRIWQVEFAMCHERNVCHKRCLLLSAGEDGQAQSWSLNLAGLFQCASSNPKHDSLINESTDRHHAGKNIWARCTYSAGDQTISYTGGADGQIVSRSYSMTVPRQDKMLRLTQPFGQIYAETQDGLMQRQVVLGSYFLLQANEVIATSVAGDLLQGFIRNGTVEWHLIEQDEGRKPLTVAPTMVSGVLYFAKQSEQSLRMLGASSRRPQEIYKLRPLRISIVEVASSRCRNEQQETCIAISYHNSCDLELVWANLSSAAPEVLRTSALLPPTFEVTSICYDAEAQVLLCGSRAGAIAVYIDVNSDSTIIEPVLCRRHVHGQDTVTSIQILKNAAFDAHDSATHYLTTGRDGHYCVLELDTSASNPSTLQMLHQASPPIAQIIEGANLVLQPNGTTKLLLHGFQSKHFIVWDETNQTQIISVDCGGAHRSWAFRPTETGEGGTFVWTKAGNFMYANQEDAGHRVIQKGGHGREIKALAVHEVEKGRYLIATGSEDTDIRLWEYNTDTGLKNISVLRKHKTGLQDLHFSSDGRKLISAAGMEELFVWQLSRIPVLGMGVVFVGALPSTDTQSDARIMSFDLRPAQDDQSIDALTIVAAFSNGKAKVIKYDPIELDSAGLGIFSVLHHIDMGEICLTQAHFLPQLSGIARPLQAFIAATNGHIAYHDTSSLEPNHPTKGVWQHRLHQNNITTLQMLVLTDQHALVVTGGDDSALAFTLAFRPPNASQPLYRSMVVPEAHAAALTALVVVDLTADSAKTSAVNDDGDREGIEAQQKHIIVVTAGNNQRIQIWSVIVDIARLRSAESDDNTNVMTGSKSMDEVQVELVEELYTNVADISNMALIGCDINNRHAQVLVVGVGMEIMDIELPIAVRQ